MKSKRIRLFIVYMVVLVVMVISYLYSHSEIGVTQSNIERDARISQNIDESWQVVKDTTSTISALLFYNQELSNNILSIYVNRPGLSFGYIFRGSGNYGEATNQEVAEFLIEGYKERVFVSMNKAQINRIEVDNGNSSYNIELDSNKPFVVILPLNIGSVSLYDINGNIIESILVRF